MSAAFIVTIPTTGPIAVKAAPENPEHILGPLQKAVGGQVEVVPYFEEVNLSDRLHGEISPEASALLSTGWIRCSTFCDEEGKLEGKAVNPLATRLWQIVQQRRKVQIDDVLVGPIAIIVGDQSYLDNL